LRKPNGRVVLTAAAPEHRSRLREIHNLAAKDLGYIPTDSVMHRFNLDHLDLVREVFPNVQRFVREDAFLFPTADAALRYYASGAIDAIEDRPPDGTVYCQKARAPMETLPCRLAYFPTAARSTDPGDRHRYGPANSRS